MKKFLGCFLISFLASVSFAGNLPPVYSSAVVSLAPVNGAQDILTLKMPSTATKRARLNRVSVTGVNSAGTSTADIRIFKRSTLSTGTSTSQTIVPMDSASPGSQALVTSFAANNNAGTSVGNVTSHKLPLAPITTLNSSNLLELINNGNDYSIILNPGEEAAVNWSGQVVTSPGAVLLDITLQWSEE